MGKFIITEQEKQQIKRLYNLITEAKTSDEIKEEFKTKFPCIVWNYDGAEFKEEGGKSVVTFFGKQLFGNIKETIDGEGEVSDGLYQGYKFKFSCKDGKFDREDIAKSAAQTEVENKLNSFPCITKNWVTEYIIRKTSDGKYIIGYQNNGGGRTWFNMYNQTYICKGGSLDGLEGKFECDGDTIKWGDITKNSTTKTVVKREVPSFFTEVTKDYPIIVGMRDNKNNEGLIYEIQKKLKELNKYNAEPDGQFGPLTYSAVVAFQKENKDEDGNPLVPDGKVGPKTLKAMGFIK
jgi:hypothetical protein